jgi:excisionase family DNA binding protein
MFLSTSQACARLGLSRWTLAKLIEDGEIEAYKGSAKNSHLKIPEESVVAYLERCKVAAPAGSDQ